MIDGFKGTTGGLGKACADRLLKQIIAEFQRDVLATLTKPIAAVGDGLLSVGQAVGAGGGLLVDGVVGGARLDDAARCCGCGSGCGGCPHRRDRGGGGSALAASEQFRRTPQ